MGILDKLMFWKKGDEFSELGLGDKPGLGKENMAFGDDFGTGQFGQQQGLPEQHQQQSFSPSSSFSQPQFPQQPSFPQQQYPRYEQQDMASKNLEVISSKLDALRVSIESLNQRLANLEAIARGEDEQRHRRRYY